MLERTHLSIIEAISRHGTMTEAANELCLTQSALSHAIKKLENNPYLVAAIAGQTRVSQLGYFLSIHADRATVGSVQPADQTQKGSLPTTTLAHDSHEFTGLNGE